MRLSAVIKRLDGDIFYQIEKIFEGALVTPPSALQPFCGKPMFCKDFDDFWFFKKSKNWQVGDNCIILQSLDIIDFKGFLRKKTVVLKFVIDIKWENE